MEDCCLTRYLFTCRTEDEKCRKTLEAVILNVNKEKCSQNLSYSGATHRPPACKLFQTIALDRLIDTNHSGAMQSALGTIFDVAGDQLSESIGRKKPISMFLTMFG